MNSADWANWTVALATVSALLLAAWQLRQNYRSSREVFAQQMWVEYLRLGLSNPELGETRIALKHLKIKDVHTLVAGDSISSQRYLWFLTVLLDACESLLCFSNQPRWVRTIRENLEYHREALAVMWEEERAFYTSKFDAVVRDVIRG